jgi:hypothetical protein
VGLKVLEELLDGPLAREAEALCGNLEEAGSSVVAAAAQPSKPPAGDFDSRAVQRVVRSTGACEVVSVANHGNTLFTLRKGAEDGMEALAHKAHPARNPTISFYILYHSLIFPVIF